MSRKRKSKLDGTPSGVLQAGAATFRERAATHGDYVTSWTAIAKVWSTYLTLALGVEVNLDARDCMHMMAQMKTMRDAAGGANIDNPMDAAVYEAMAATL